MRTSKSATSTETVLFAHGLVEQKHLFDAWAVGLEGPGKTGRDRFADPNRSRLTSARVVATEKVQIRVTGVVERAAKFFFAQFTLAGFAFHLRSCRLAFLEVFLKMRDYFFYRGKNKLDCDLVYLYKVSLFWKHNQLVKLTTINSIDKIMKMSKISLIFARTLCWNSITNVQHWMSYWYFFW